MQRPKLTKKQMRGIEGLISKKSKAAAARLAGCRRETIYRWLKQSEFRIALEKARIQGMSGEREAPGREDEASAIMEGLIAAGADRLGYSGLIEEGRQALKIGIIPFDLMDRLRRGALRFEQQIKGAGYSIGFIVRIKKRY